MNFLTYDLIDRGSAVQPLSLVASKDLCIPLDVTVPHIEPSSFALIADYFILFVSYV